MLLIDCKTHLYSLSTFLKCIPFQFFESVSLLPKKVKKSKKRQPSEEMDLELPKSKKQTRKRSMNDFYNPKNSKQPGEIGANVLTQKNIVETKTPGPKLSYCKDVSGRGKNDKEGNVLFNDALNMLYGIRTRNSSMGPTSHHTMSGHSTTELDKEGRKYFV